MWIILASDMTIFYKTKPVSFKFLQIQRDISSKYSELI